MYIYIRWSIFTCFRWFRTQLVLLPPWWPDFPLFSKNMFCLLRKNVLQFKKCKARKPTLETWKNDVLHEVQKNPGSEHMSAFYGSASFRYWRRWWMWRRRRWLILPQAHLQELDTRPNTTKGWWILGQDPQPDQMATLEWVAICAGQL